jgi:hypothetical protein
MIEIKDLLARFSNLLQNNEGKKLLIQEAIKKETGILIESKNIKIKNGVIFLDIKPIYKNEIFLKQNEIFLELQKLLGKKTPQDIR